MVAPVTISRVRPSRYPSRPLLALLLVLMGLLLSGCVRVQAALALSPRDTVAGDIVVAARPGSPQPALAVPSDLRNRVQVEPYSQDGYAGSRLRFDGLSFAAVGELAEISPLAQDNVRLELHRAGDRVVIAAHADLTRLAAQDADVQLKISVPGRVLSTDADTGDGTLSWRFVPGQVTQVNATVDYPDPAGPSAASWALLLGGVVALSACAVVLLAMGTRHRLPTRARRGY